MGRRTGGARGPGDEGVREEGVGEQSGAVEIWASQELGMGSGPVGRCRDRIRPATAVLACTSPTRMGSVRLRSTWFNPCQPSPSQPVPSRPVPSRPVPTRPDPAWPDPGLMNVARPSSRSSRGIGECQKMLDTSSRLCRTYSANDVC